MFFLAVNFALYFRLRGFVLSLYPQHGQNNPSHFTKISQTWHRFWPVPIGFIALWRTHIPLQTILLFHSPFVFLLRNHPMTKADSVRICSYVSMLFRRYCWDQETDEIYWNIYCNLNLLGYLVIRHILLDWDVKLEGTSRHIATVTSIAFSAPLPENGLIKPYYQRKWYSPRL